MVPDSEPVSAISAYSQGLTSKSRRRRRYKQRKNASSEALVKETANDKASVLKTKKANKKAALKQKQIEKMKTKAASQMKGQSEVILNAKGDDGAKQIKKKKQKKQRPKREEPAKSILKKKAATLIDKKKTVFSSFNSANDSLDLVFPRGSLRKITTSTPAKREVFADVDEDSNESEEGVTEKVDSYVSELEEAKLFRVKRKRSVVRKIENVKKLGLGVQESSHDLGESAFATLLSPMKPQQFMKSYWEKQLLHIPASDPQKFSKLLSTQLMDKTLRNEVLWFGRDLDITTYTDGGKQNHNIEGARAQAHVVWDYYSNGCSVRLLHPHTHSKHLLVLMSALQEYFGAMVGANSYLTPPSSQGFAPHYDDIEAFILQLEGKKRWRVYKPRSKNDVLPRYSSPNFSEADMTEPPVFDAILSPGDLLYFPRGYIHQAHTLHNEHSLHVTISVYQKTAWCDLMEKLIPNALQKAITNDIEFRRGLPLGYLHHAGKFVRPEATHRKSLIHTAKTLISKLVNFVDIDRAVDELGIQFAHDSLPPVLSTAEAACSVIGNGWRMEGSGKLKNKIDFPLNTRIRFTRMNCYRLIEEHIKDDEGELTTEVRLYYTLDNSKLYHGEEPNFLVIEPDMLNAAKALVVAYPEYIEMSALPCDNEDKVYGFVCNLWDYGLIVTEVPPEPIDDLTTTMTAVLPNDLSVDGSISGEVADDSNDDDSLEEDDDDEIVLEEDLEDSPNTNSSMEELDGIVEELEEEDGESGDISVDDEDE